jgi:hydroxymethylpyrimidine pyrophosphatase-like HAD family hydrolase
VGERIAETESPYETIASVDPFTGSGLIDCLPRGVSKDYALGWWVNHLGRSREEIVFAGDSGNDLAALTAGYRSIIVSNADASVTERARELHRSVGWTDRLFVASRPATSGVLEGLRHYLSQELTSGDRDRRVHHRHRRHDLPGDGLH